MKDPAKVKEEEKKAEEKKAEGEGEAKKAEGAAGDAEPEEETEPKTEPIVFADEEQIKELDQKFHLSEDKKGQTQ